MIILYFHICNTEKVARLISLSLFPSSFGCKINARRATFLLSPRERPTPLKRSYRAYFITVTLRMCFYKREEFALEKSGNSITRDFSFFSLSTCLLEIWVSLGLFLSISGNRLSSICEKNNSNVLETGK